MSIDADQRQCITPVLKSLPPLPFSIDFKVLLVVWECLKGLGPSCLYALLLGHKPSWTLGSSGIGLFSIPKVSTKTSGEASFHYYGPRLWTSLLESLRGAENVDVSKNRLLTHLLNLAFLTYFTF